jgi:hypothetical protein
MARKTQREIDRGDTITDPEQREEEGLMPMEFEDLDLDLGGSEPDIEDDTNFPDQIAALDVAALRNKREALLKELEELDDLIADKQVHILVTSKVMSPVALFRQMFIRMHAEGKPRKDIIAFGVRKGIAPNTCKTQYQINKQKWDRGELSIEDLEDEGSED